MYLYKNFLFMFNLTIATFSYITYRRKSDRRSYRIITI